ncbi:MAG: hypothetical protein JXB50_04615 [Spirochaetes bacterium]|nr:hypothetical protein [Spirochaetota bacterium]
MLEKKDYYSLIFILILIISFLSFTYFGFTKLFNDDCMQQSFPRLVAIARHIQNGEIPFWDSNTFSGAKPFYNVFETAIYNVFLYPFFLSANTNNPDQCYFVLYLLPFTFYMILAGFACYLIGSKVIKLNVYGSISIAVIFSFSPLFSISFDSLLNTGAHAFMALMIFTFCMFIEKNSLKWWLLSLASTVFLNLTFQLNYTIRSHFIVVMIIILILLFSKKSIKEKSIIFIKAMSVFIFSTLLCSFIWTGVLEGINLLKQMNIRTEDLADQNSMHPLSLMTLLIPNFFGVNSGANALGAGIDGIYSSTTLSGGLFTLMSVFTCILFLINKKQLDEISKDSSITAWSKISLILFFLSLLSMAGKFTPIYKILGIIFPFVYKLPHPIYFNNLQALGTALCAGIGVSLIIDSEKIRKMIFKPKSIITIILSLLLLIVTMTNIAFLLKNEPINPFKTLSVFIENKWFLSDPGIYFIIAVLFMLFFLFINKNKIFNYLFFIVIISESVYIGQQVLYERNELILPHEKKNYRLSVLGDYAYPKDSPMYQKTDEIKKRSEELNCRFTGSTSELDNLAWITGGKSLLGYDSKPISSYMINLVNSYARYDLYEMSTIKYPKRFMQNMNVGLFVSHSGIVSDSSVFQNKKNDDYLYLQEDKEIIEKIKNDEMGYEDIFVSPELQIYKIPDFLPYIYTNNSISSTQEEDQINRLMFDDLRETVYLNREDYEKIKEENLNLEKNNLENFFNLQKENKLLTFNNKYANKVELNIDIKRPSILIINEIYHPDWNVYINGIKGKLLRINYLQQGIFLKQGRHEIILKFFPEKTLYGLIISLLTLTILIISLIIRKLLIRSTIKIRKI